VPAPGPPLITPAQDPMSTVRLKRRLLLSPGCGHISKRRGSSRRPVPVTKSPAVGARLRQPWLQGHPLAEAVSDAEPWCVGGDEVPMWDARLRWHDGAASASPVTIDAVQIVLRTRTSDGTEVILSALVYAKLLEEHPAVADLELIDRTIREPDERRPDPRPGRERFFRREGDVWVLAVVDFEGVPAIIVTVFSTERPPF